MYCTSKIKLNDQGCGLINNASFVIKLHTCNNTVFTLNEDDVEIFYFTTIQNKYWQTFLYEYKHVWYTAQMLLHVKMLKVHLLSSYPCQCQSKHDEGNIKLQYSSTRQANKKSTCNFSFMSRQFIINKNYIYFSEQCARNVILLKL